MRCRPPLDYPPEPHLPHTDAVLHPSACPAPITPSLGFSFSSTSGTRFDFLLFSHSPVLLICAACIQEFDDETIRERIIALQEMFPTPVQTAIGAVGSTTTWIASSSVGWVKRGGWLAASTTIMMAIPMMICQQLDIQQLELEKLITGSSVQQSLLSAGPQL
jgi:hypothetical protein